MVGWNTGDRGVLTAELWPWAALLLVLAVGVLLTFQALHERLGRGRVALLGFVAWGVPMMVATVLVVAFQQYGTAVYVLTPCAPLVGAWALVEAGLVYGDGGATTSELLRSVTSAGRTTLSVGVALYGGLALLTQVWRQRWARAMRRDELDGGALEHR